MKFGGSRQFPDSWPMRPSIQHHVNNCATEFPATHLDSPMKTVLRYFEGGTREGLREGTTINQSRNWLRDSDANLAVPSQGQTLVSVRRAGLRWRAPWRFHPVAETVRKPPARWLYRRRTSSFPSGGRLPCDRPAERGLCHGKRR